MSSPLGGALGLIEHHILGGLLEVLAVEPGKSLGLGAQKNSCEACGVCGLC